MKKILYTIVAIAVAVNLYAADDKFCVIRTSDLSGEDQYEIMTATDFKTYSKEHSVFFVCNLIY